MSKRLPLLFFVLLSILCPLFVLAWTGFLQLGIWPACAEPFGLNRILLGYLVACLPVSLVAAAWFHSRFRQWASSVRLLAILGGLGVAFASAFVSQQQIVSLVGDQQLGRHFIRIAWTFALQFPWAMAACFSIVDSDETIIRKPDMKSFATATLVVLVVPICYVEFVIDRQLGIFQAERDNLQVARAWKTVRRLNSLGANAWNFNRSVSADFDSATRRNRLPQTELELAKELGSIYRFLDSETLEKDSTDQQKINYALQLSKLAGEKIDRDYLSEAIDILRTNDLYQKHPRAALVMGSICEHQSEFEEAVEHFAKVIELSPTPDDPVTSPADATVFIAYERLANNLRRIGKGKEAEKLLLAARDKFPEQTLVFDYQLGLHYEVAGRPVDAIGYYRKIPASTPRFGALAVGRTSNIQKSQLGCRIGNSR